MIAVFVSAFVVRSSTLTLPLRQLHALSLEGAALPVVAGKCSG
jgi:hypothetical protein